MEKTLNQYLELRGKNVSFSCSGSMIIMNVL